MPGVADKYVPWEPEEDDLLQDAVLCYESDMDSLNWKDVAKLVSPGGGRNPGACRNRWNRLQATKRHSVRAASRHAFNQDQILILTEIATSPQYHRGEFTRVLKEKLPHCESAAAYRWLVKFWKREGAGPAGAGVDVPTPLVEPKITPHPPPRSFRPRAASGRVVRSASLRPRQLTAVDEDEQMLPPPDYSTQPARNTAPAHDPKESTNDQASRKSLFLLPGPGALPPVPAPAPALVQSLETPTAPEVGRHYISDLKVQAAMVAVQAEHTSPEAKVLANAILVQYMRNGAPE